MRSASSFGFSNATSASSAPNGFSRVRHACAISLAMILLAGATPVRGQELDVPAEKVLGDKPGNMMSRYWLAQAEKAAERWRTEYEARETPEQISAYQSRLREKFLEAIGGLPERTPLEAKVTGTIRREGYRVEKVIFESQRKHFVTALLFVPEASRFPSTGWLMKETSARMLGIFAPMRT